MLKLYDTSKNFIKYLNDYQDLCIESDLVTGDKTLSFVMLGKVPELQNECYIRTEEDEFVVKELHPDAEGTECSCQLNLEALEASKFEQFTAKDTTITAAAALALAGTGWRVSTGITKQRSVQAFLVTPLTVLGLIRDAFMCEMRFDTLNQVVEFAEEFGEYKGVYLRRGLNLKKASITVDTYDYYTRIVPIGEDGLRISEVNNGIDYVENYQYSNKIRTLIWEDSSYEDAEKLKEDAIAKLADLSKPKRSYEADVIDLARQNTEYSLLSYALGDAVDLIDEMTGVMDRQRIVSMKKYPQTPEQNTISLSNTTLTWEELQDRLNKAAEAWEDATNSDGTIKGVYVHGVSAGDVVGIETVVNDTINTSETIETIRIDLSQTQDDISTAQANLTALDGRVGQIETTYLTATSAELKYATIEDLTATKADVRQLSANFIESEALITEQLGAHTAVINSLSTTYATIDSLDATNAIISNLDATYATLDLANVVAGSIKTAMIDTGAVQTAQIADGSITDAKIVGLTASKITAGTLNAGNIDVINLNADNITTGTINGQRIAGGAIDASKLTQELAETIESAVTEVEVLYAQSDSPIVIPVSGWSQTAPEREEGKYIWQKTVTSYADGSSSTSEATCISGADGQSGADGEDAVVLRIDSTRGNMFKNNSVSTVLKVTIYAGAERITGISALRSRFGTGAYLQWYWQRLGETTFGEILSTDSKLSNDGFSLTLTPDEVDTKITFMCELVT